MRFARKNLTPKARRFFTLGNICLCAGLTMSLFDKDLGQRHAAIYDGVRGLLMGLSIAFMFGAFRMSSNCNQPQP